MCHSVNAGCNSYACLNITSNKIHQWIEKTRACFQSDVYSFPYAIDIQTCPYFVFYSERNWNCPHNDWWGKACESQLCLSLCPTHTHSDSIFRVLWVLWLWTASAFPLWVGGNYHLMTTVDSAFWLSTNCRSPSFSWLHAFKSKVYLVPCLGLVFGTFLCSEISRFFSLGWRPVILTGFRLFSTCSPD
jgi:hypothetical protein